MHIQIYIYYNNSSNNNNNDNDKNIINNNYYDNNDHVEPCPRRPGRPASSPARRRRAPWAPRMP